MFDDRASKARPFRCPLPQLLVIALPMCAAGSLPWPCTVQHPIGVALFDRRAETQKSDVIVVPIFWGNVRINFG